MEVGQSRVSAQCACTGLARMWRSRGSQPKRAVLSGQGSYVNLRRSHVNISLSSTTSTTFGCHR